MNSAEFRKYSKRKNRELFILKIIEKVMKNEKVDKLITIGVNALAQHIEQPKRTLITKIVYLPKRNKSNKQRSEKTVIRNCPFPW